MKTNLSAWLVKKYTLFVINHNRTSTFLKLKLKSKVFQCVWVSSKTQDRLQIFNYLKWKKIWQIMFKDTWNVDWITYTFGYILHRSCWPSFVRRCCTIKSIATWLSPPRGMITSAYFFDGRTKSSKAGLTNFAYYTSQH